MPKKKPAKPRRQLVTDGDMIRQVWSDDYSDVAIGEFMDGIPVADPLSIAAHHRRVEEAAGKHE